MYHEQQWPTHYYQGIVRIRCLRIRGTQIQVSDQVSLVPGKSVFSVMLVQVQGLRAIGSQSSGIAGLGLVEPGQEQQGKRHIRAVNIKC